MYTDIFITFIVTVKPCKYSPFQLDKTCKKYSCQMRLDRYLG